VKTKLTLSLPAAKIQSAKQIARWRNTTVSALFEESIESWERAAANASIEQTEASGELEALLGAFATQPPFDRKSARIRQKHG